MLTIIFMVMAGVCPFVGYGMAGVCPFVTVGSTSGQFFANPLA